MAFSNTAKATNDFVTGRKSVVFPAGIEVVAQRYSMTLATADLASGVVGVVGILPAGCIPCAFEIDAAALDSGTALAYSVGIVNAAESAISTAAADGGAAWATGVTTGRTSAGHGGFVSSRAMKTVQNSQVDRNVGISVTAAAGTAVSGDFNLTLWYRAA